MSPRLTLEVSKFNAAMLEMRSRLGNTVPLGQIIDHEVGRILELALRRTDTATVASIRKNQKARRWVTYNGKRYFLGNRYPKALWGAIKAERAASLERHLAARGLAKRSWLSIANKLGIDIEAPDYVRKAQTKKIHDNATVKRQASPGVYGVTIANASPLMRWTGGQAALSSAIAGRRKFYEQNVKRGVFDQLETVTRKYPGLKMVR